jgi:hypothetical protein
MLTMPPADDALLTRKELAQALTGEGYPIRPATLARMAVTGDGPDYSVFGRTPIYQWRTSLAWAHGRLVAPRSRSVAA